MVEPTYKSISIAKQAERESRIPQKWKITLPEDDNNLMDLPRQCGIFTEDEMAITEAPDSVELLSMIHSGQLTSLAVTEAFCKVIN
jgi:amidase